MKAWLASFITRHLIADDPNPEPSRLDRLDGRDLSFTEHRDSYDPEWVEEGQAS